MANIICRGENVKISYEPGTITAVDGSKLESFTNMDVTNNSTALPNQAPTINFTKLPANLRVHKAATSLNFNIKATDADTTIDKNLTTEFYLDTGGGFKKITSFTANGTTYAGVLPAINGTVYAIKINKTSTLIPTNVVSFKLKAVTKDSGDAKGENVVNLSHYNTAPSITISGLTTDQKISKHDSTFSFSLTPSDSDTIDENLHVELYLVIEGKETRVNNFTAGGAEITDGNLAAKSNQTYNIIIDKSLPADNPLLPNTVDKFTLKAVNILEFRLKVKDDDTADANLETEIYIGIFGSYQKITEFTVDGVQNTAGKLTAQNGTENNHLQQGTTN